MVRRNILIGKSDCLQTFQTPHQGEISLQHTAVKLGDTWWEVQSPAQNPNGSAMNIVSTDGERSAHGAVAFDEVICASTKTDDEVKEWTEEYKKKQTTYDITHNNCQHFCFEFVKWASEGRCDLRQKITQGDAVDGDEEVDDEAPEQESALSKFFLKLTKSAANCIAEFADEKIHQAEAAEEM